MHYSRVTCGFNFMKKGDRSFSWLLCFLKSTSPVYSNFYLGQGQVCQLVTFSFDVINFGYRHRAPLLSRNCSWKIFYYPRCSLEKGTARLMKSIWGGGRLRGSNRSDLKGTERVRHRIWGWIDPREVQFGTGIVWLEVSADINSAIFTYKEQRTLDRMFILFSAPCPLTFERIWETQQIPGGELNSNNLTIFDP